GRPATRPADFDLGEAWALIADQVEQLRAPVVVHAIALPRLVTILAFVFGGRLTVGDTLADGRVEVEIRGHSLESLAGELGGFGAGVEVLSPVEVRRSLARVGCELTALYGS
ncbi:MAG: WYL domain-containing protein, partial [Actinobacteria bacterium]|nr:WYL domain-containing protein [Actinomycetota bacterium]